MDQLARLLAAEAAPEGTGELWYLLVAVLVVVVIAIWFAKALARRRREMFKGEPAAKAREEAVAEPVEAPPKAARPKKRAKREPAETGAAVAAREPVERPIREPARKPAKKRGKRAAVKAKVERAEAVPILEQESVEAEVAEPVVTDEATSWEQGLAKTKKEGFVAKLGKLFTGKQFDEQLLDQLEEVLFTADIGTRTAEKLLNGIRERMGRKEIKNPEKVWHYLKKETRSILASSQDGGAAEVFKDKPHVIMVIGVNGSGKTTTIGKMAHKYKTMGKKILLAAGDTFRAAAVEQLEIWAERVGVAIHKGKEKADPASVIYDAVERGVAEGFDIIIADTAGRLHTKVNLVEELKKVNRVIAKVKEGAPHEVLLVLDATTGQNAIQQADIFKEELGVTSLVLTKLDGTAKGGVIIGICDEMKIPVKYVGIGEKLQDLRGFEPEAFVDALFAGTGGGSSEAAAAQG